MEFTQNANWYEHSDVHPDYARRPELTDIPAIIETIVSKGQEVVTRTTNTGAPLHSIPNWLKRMNIWGEADAEMKLSAQAGERSCILGHPGPDEAGELEEFIRAEKR